jgi:hypothetical protein
MRSGAFAVLVAVVSVFGTEAALAHHRSHSHVSVGVGFGFGYPYWGPGWWGPWGPWYYPGPYYYPAPAVVVPSQPVTYIEKGSAPAAESWWYYCDASKSYYPYVKECPSGWQRVPPAPPPSR